MYNIIYMIIYNFVIDFITENFLNSRKYSQHNDYQRLIRPHTEYCTQAWVSVSRYGN